MPCNTGSYFQRPLDLIRVLITWRNAELSIVFICMAKTIIETSNSEVAGAFSLQNKAKQQTAM